MTFKLHVEHQVIGGKTVLEEFEGVESFNNPPMVDTLQINFADDRDDKKLDYGHVARAETDNGIPKTTPND